MSTHRVVIVVDVTTDRPDSDPDDIAEGLIDEWRFARVRVPELDEIEIVGAAWAGSPSADVLIHEHGKEVTG